MSDLENRALRDELFAAAAEIAAIHAELAHAHTKADKHADISRSREDLLGRQDVVLKSLQTELLAEKAGRASDAAEHAKAVKDLYADRASAVVLAAALAHAGGAQAGAVQAGAVQAGVRIDRASDPEGEWPVLAIGLGQFGEVSWHLAAGDLPAAVRSGAPVAPPWDQSDKAEGASRIERFAAATFAP